MGKTEEIYTVHVKSRSDPNHKYPSERAYSSSTTGGLAITHLFLSFLGGALSSAIFSNTGELIGGATLVTSGLISGTTGIFAWKRWYIDRYVRWFFSAALLSLFASCFSASLTIYCLLCPSLEKDYFLKISDSEVSEEVPFVKEFHIHMILTSFMEALISIISIKVAWKGVKNSYKKKPIIPVRTDGVGGNPETPDILENHKNSKDSNYSNVMKELYRLQKTLPEDTVGNRVLSGLCEKRETNGLPMPESQKEYRERMEKFLSSNHNDC